MPGPAVYVVVAVVSAVATGYVIKEFIYKPHIAPMIRGWIERQKAHRASQRRMYSPVPAASEHRSPHHSPTRNSPPIELETVVASEVNEWRTSANIRRRQTNNVLDDQIPTGVDYPLLSPSTPLARSPPHVLRPPLSEATPIHLSRPLSSPAALPIPNLASFATDVDYTASSVDVTPLAQTAVLQSNLTSPQLTATSPFSDVFELTQSRISELEIVHAGSGSDDEVFSVSSSMSSVTATDDEDDNDFLGSGESWHNIRNEANSF
ncbi:hypothetical protein BDM02DRAFT_3187653 [Thelephora ganbajun]|uniref:Uncharacterized protein n=1 Tax=Thelephora ganbajun TaxID=370292 RepID=A0ACB6ZE43_THEGA|nr:hypothetical protein BDM02DRAFT_3187653 [Thelephora ganbajun]